MKLIKMIPATRVLTLYALYVGFLLAFFLLMTGFTTDLSQDSNRPFLPLASEGITFQLSHALGENGTIEVALISSWQSEHPDCSITIDLLDNQQTVLVELISYDLSGGVPGEEIARLSSFDPETGACESFLLKRDGGGVLVVLVDF